jgi:hypothetical protein
MAPDFDATTLLNVVDDLLGQLNNPANPPTPIPAQEKIRTVGNRAYYSQYCYLRKRIVDESADCFSGKGGLHKPLSDACQSVGRQSNNGILRTVGTNLQNLRVFREGCDYTWKEPHPTLPQAKLARQWALSLKSSIARLRPQDIAEIYKELNSRT